MSNYTNPSLRERIKNEVMAGSKGGKPGQWSARKAQILNARYKKAGGGFKGPKTKAQKSLSNWTKQDWGYSGKGKGVYLPKAKRQALKGTPQGRKRLARAEAAKRMATKKGKQFSRHGLAAGTSRS